MVAVLPGVFSLLNINTMFRVRESVLPPHAVLEQPGRS